MKNGHSPLDVSKILEGSRIIVVGGTGFLGKVWLSLLLCHYPDVGKVFLVVRSKGSQDSEARFWTDIAPSEPLRAAAREAPWGAVRGVPPSEDPRGGRGRLKPALCGFSTELRKEIERHHRRGGQRGRRGGLQPAARRGPAHQRRGDAEPRGARPRPGQRAGAAHQHLLRGGLPVRAHRGARPPRLPPSRAFRTCPTPRSGIRTARSSRAWRWPRA
nr:SDR family oxidoreductase [Deltaproteobacteria bacterium]